MFSLSPLAKKGGTRAALDGTRWLEDGHSQCFCRYPAFLYFPLPLSEEDSYILRTQQLVFQGSAEQDWLFLGHYLSKSSAANETFPGIMLQCCCSSFSTQILNNVRSEKINN